MVPSRLRTPSEMASVRMTSWCHSQRKPSAASARHGRRSTVLGGRRRAAGVTTMANTSAADTANVAGVDDERQGEADEQQQAGQRRAENWLATSLGREHPPVGPLEVRSSTIAGRNVWALLS